MSTDKDNKSKLKAATLRYNAGEDASPKMVAKGPGTSRPEDN